MVVLFVAILAEGVGSFFVGIDGFRYSTFAVMTGFTFLYFLPCRKGNPFAIAIVSVVTG